MQKDLRRFMLVGGLAFCGLVGLLLNPAGSLVAREELPKQLSDEAFWQLATDLSEPGGYFRSDNFVSNETTFQWVIPQLKHDIKPNGVYLGVGPDQNFTYIAAIQPRIAFIVDIRRQNMMQHLMYKALIEMSATRSEFISRLFSRNRAPDLAMSASPEEIFAAYAALQPQASLYDSNLNQLLQRLKTTRGFTISSDDERMIRTVYRAFFELGPDITYSGPGFGRSRMPTYEQLMVLTDNEGKNHSYMASEENFHLLRNLQLNNLIIPVVGDFAGDKAIRAVGEYLKRRGAAVSVFYLSNVEQYLFQDPNNWKKFYTNVETLPLEPVSTFIRSIFNVSGFSQPRMPAGFPTRSINRLASIPETLKAFKSGQVTSYYDVLQLSR